MAALNMREPVAESIEAHYEASQSPADHPTLRASEIGDECDRRLWYRLHWAIAPKRWSGRMLRLFETGRREEDRIIANLRVVGVVVANQQAGITALAKGLLTGSIDGTAINLPGAAKTLHLLECKTHNDAQWKNWRKLGVRRSHPKHYAQMQVYMSSLKLTRGLYVGHNKDTDDLEFERIEFDPVFAAQVEAKAERIAFCDRAPPRLSDKPDFWVCKLCDLHALCHGTSQGGNGGTIARAHCRTCLHSTFDEQKPVEMHCGRHKTSLDLAKQAEGCQHHLFIPSLINGEQIDADESAETVTYRMRDGSTFIDGV